MKIKKIKKLYEDANDDTSEVAELDMTAASVGAIADAIQADVEDDTDGEKSISDATAQAIATQVKDDAEEVGAQTAEVILTPDDIDDVELDHRLVPFLDGCLKAAKRARRAKNRSLTGDSADFNGNILIEGLPGSGKTAVIYAWAKSRGIHMVAINMNNSKLDAAVNGLPLSKTDKMTNAEGKEVESKIVSMIYSDYLKDLTDPKYAGNCVIFCDEYNRQANASLRAVMLTIFNEKRTRDGSLDFSDNLLFSIVAMNPPGKGNDFNDAGAVALPDVELNRFATKLMGDKGIDSDPDDTLKYFKSSFKKQLAGFGIIMPNSKAAGKYNKTGITRQLSEDDKEDLLDLIKEQILAEKLLNDPTFSFTTREELPELVAVDRNSTKYDLFTSRGLTEGIRQYGHSVADFLVWVDNLNNFLPSTNQMFHDILDGWDISPAEIAAYYRKLNLSYPDPNVPFGTASAAAGATASTANNTQGNADDNDSGVVDDDADSDIWVKNTTGKQAASASEARKTILDILGSLK